MKKAKKCLKDYEKLRFAADYLYRTARDIYLHDDAFTQDSGRASAKERSGRDNALLLALEDYARISGLRLWDKEP